MLLTITCEGAHAPDLGFLVMKNPASVLVREMSAGKVTVFYPENTAERATIALVLEIDPIELVRRRGAMSLDQYVNDRPYVASSFMSVALREVFSTALGGRSSERPELVETKLPLRASLPALHLEGEVGLLARLFGPLGYELRVTEHPLSTQFPGWGRAPIVSFELAGTQTVHDLLSHLYVLLPVLDDDKHYFVSADEVAKLLEHGRGWLDSHPERELIARRYLAHQRKLVDEALSQLTIGQPENDAVAQAGEDALESRIRLGDVRIAAVVAALRATQPPVARIVDMGCGEGRLLRLLLEDRGFTEIVGVDVSSMILGRAEKKLGLDRRPPADAARVKLLQGSLVYSDRRLAGYDALALVEVIEHIDAERLGVVEQVIFGQLRARRVIITTPNAEYNVRFERLPVGAMRHADHRFEWTRAEFQTWARRAERHGYRVRFEAIGPVDPEVGAPTQMAIFDRVSA